MRECQKCNATMVRPAAQQSLGEWLLGLLTIYPSRCQHCGHRFLALWGRPAFVPRRDYRRVRVQCRGKVQALPPHSPGAAEDGTIADLSIAGCRIDGPRPLPIGTHLRLEIAASDEEPPITVDEAVVRSHPRSGIGVAFTNIRSDERERIAAIVEGRLTGVTLSESAASVARKRELDSTRQGNR